MEEKRRLQRVYPDWWRDSWTFNRLNTFSNFFKTFFVLLAVHYTHQYMLCIVATVDPSPFIPPGKGFDDFPSVAFAQVSVRMRSKYIVGS